jgi:hypothetical protein
MAAKGTCSVCASPIVAEINSALRAGEKLRDLEKRSGVSRASLSRHHRRCVSRDVMEKHRAGRFDASKQLVFVKWPCGAVNMQCVPYMYAGQLRSVPDTEDMIVSVEFETAVPPRVLPTLKPEIVAGEAAHGTAA